MLKKTFKLLLLLIVVTVGYFAYWANTYADFSKLPQLQSGDLIFQTSVSAHTLPIIVATLSPYTHAGIVHNDNGKYSVIHAGGEVLEETLAEFVTRGIGEHFFILRNAALTEAQRAAIVTESQRYIGRKYDRMFYAKNEEIYCSELIHLAYGAQNVAVGKVEYFRDLYMNNGAVRDLFEKRWKSHPACQSPDMNYDACWNVVLNEEIITPASIASDSKLTLVYSNYWF